MNSANLKDQLKKRKQTNLPTYEMDFFFISFVDFYYS